MNICKDVYGPDRIVQLKKWRRGKGLCLLLEVEWEEGGGVLKEKRALAVVVTIRISPNMH